MKEYTAILKQADIFFGFTPTQVELLANLCRDRSYRLGEVIFRENSKSDELYIIAQGDVDILINPDLVSEHAVADSEPIKIATLKKGQSFGEIALVDQGVRSATARAAQEGTHLLIIPRDKLKLLCNTYPNLGYRLMGNLAADLALKIRNTDLLIREKVYYRLWGS